jgi:UPF0755 protein
MRKILTLTIILTFITVGVGALIWWQISLRAPSNDTAPRSVVINKGSTAEKIGESLQKAGVIKSKLAFKIYIQLNGLSTSLPTGEFRIPANLSIEGVIQKLLQGPEEVWVTIPEGLRREEIAERFVEGFSLSGTAAQNFKTEFLSQTQSLEGYLFPDTYLFPKEASSSAVVSRMETTFNKRFGNTFSGSNGLTLAETVTLASILERETKTKQERPIVAGILMNRLNADWPIQADATVQYAIASVNCRTNSDCTWWPRPLSHEDLGISSRYNTYKYPGLPPGPIANPGLSSLEAVANYEKTSYWFYIHDSDGIIHYAETLEEHNQNVNDYLVGE